MEDIRCVHCGVIVLLKQRAAEGIKAPDFCPMCGEKITPEPRATAPDGPRAATRRPRPT